MRTAKIGERHIQTGEVVELYPGEWAQVSEVDGREMATVEPEPGVRAWLRRAAYRVFGPVAEWLHARKKERR